MCYVFDDYTLDTQRYELRRAEQRVGLEPKAFDLLRYLVEHRDRVVGRAELLEQVWPEQFISDHSLTARLRAIRQALGDTARQPRFIETVHGRGYRFIGSVRPSSEAADARDASPPPVLSQRSALADGTMAPADAVPMVGRAAEIAVLHECLDRARDGRRQVVFVTGEAGLGKTTLVNAFVHEVGQAEALWIGRGQCIDHYGSGEAYLPVLEALELMCQASGGDEMLAVLARHAPTWLVQMPWLLSSVDLERLQPRTLGTTGQRMLRELARALEVLSTTKPLLLVLEDLHWSDYSTLDLLAMLARRQETARVLVLGTYRPEEVIGQDHPLYAMTHELHIHGYCEVLSLTFLSEAAVAAYLRARFPGTSDLEALSRFVHRRTEGNALFMVNVVDEMVERGGFGERRMPESIRQLLDQRLERLSPDEQRVLEVGSIAGAEFAAAAVASMLEGEIEPVEVCCEGLTRRGQWLQTRGTETWPDGTVSGRYGFIHALYQEVAYHRVTPARRFRLHRRIGERLETGYGTQAEELAAELAGHFEEGQIYQKAVQYREQAAENAIRRSAYQEAIVHLTHGLELLERWPDTPERTSQALSLSITLGASLTATKGFAAPEVEHIYDGARKLCRQGQDDPQMFAILRGLYICYLVRGEYRQALDLAEQLLQLANRLPESAFLLLASYGLGQVLFFLGNFVRARQCLAQGIALYDPVQHRTLAFRYVTSPGVTCRSYGAWALWLLGYPDQARQWNHEALALAEDISQPFQLAFCLTYAAAFHQRRREVQLTQERVESVIALSSEQGFSHWLAHARILQGWVLTAQGRHEDGIHRMRQALSAYRATGAQVQIPYYLGLLADAYGQVGQTDAGLTVLAEALTQATRSGEYWYEAELHRLKGELLRQLDGGGGRVAESTPEEYFQKAIEIARRQQAKSLELRAAMSLARLWQQQGKRHEAYDLLAPIYGWFTEGFDTADLQEAKVLLRDLS